MILQNDVYSITIAANMTHQSPAHLNYCLKQCWIVFVLQTAIAYLYLQDSNFKDMDNFQPFYPTYTVIRVLMLCLMQKNFYNDMQQTLKLLIFLKWQSDATKFGKRRFMNIMLASLKLFHPIFLLFTLMVTNP